jgi:VanZ family protein
MSEREYDLTPASSDMAAKNYWIITAIMAGVIVYGSLFPFDFGRPNPDIGAVRELLRTWAEPPPSLGNLAANLLLYVPLGFFEVLALQRFGTTKGFALTLFSGLILCTWIELAQYYDAGRVTNASDVYLNTLGTGMGALGGLLAGRHFERLLRKGISADPIPAMLLIGWLGYRLFPYVPTIDLHKYWDSLKPIFLNPTLSDYDLVRSAIIWLAIASLIESVVGGKRSRLLYPLAVAFVLGAKVIILTKVVTLAELLGSVISFALWLPLVEIRPGQRNRVLAVTFAGLVVAQRLEPFQFQVPAGHFGLIPFVSLMDSSLSVNIQSFFEKFFLYGTLIWLICEMGVSWMWATVLAFVILLVTSLAEIYLPGRSAEITDSIMALMIGVIFSLVRRAAAHSDRTASMHAIPTTDT